MRRSAGLFSVVLVAFSSCGVEPPKDFNAFADFAAMGKVEEVQAGLRAHPEWAKSTNPTNGRTPMHSAALLGRVEVAKLLLAAGADPNAKATEYGATPMHVAAESGQDEYVEYLLAKKVTVDPRDNEGRTPLLAAAFGSDANTYLVRILLDAGAAIEATDNRGFTPLLLASIRGNADMVKLLLERGAKHAVTAGDGRTPLSAARDGNYDSVVAMLEAAGAK
jgi:ankyrin repeat protein